MNILDKIMKKERELLNRERVVLEQPDLRVLVKEAKNHEPNPLFRLAAEIELAKKAA